MHALLLSGRICAVAVAIIGACAGQQTVLIDPAAYHHRTVVSGDTVHVFTWTSSSATFLPLRYNRSEDSGRTWGTPVVIANNVVLTDAVTDGLHVLVALWTPTGSRLLRSTDGGLSWLPPAPVPRPTPGQGVTRLAMVQGVLVAAWSESRVGPGDVYVNRSVDHGVTWAPGDIRIDVGPPDQGSFAGGVYGDARAIYVFYEDGVYPQNSIFLSKSLDLGVTWDPNARLVTNDSAHVSVSGPIVLADSLTFAPGSTVQRSADYGATWAPTPLPQYSAFALSGSTAVAAIASPGGTWPILHSTDGGATWLPAAGTQVATGGGILRVDPSFHGDTAGMVASYWLGCCGPTFSAYFVSTDRGATWRRGAVLNESGGTLTGLANGLFATYSTGSGTALRVLGFLYHGFQPYGPATAGTGGITPNLERSGTPSPANTVTLTVTAAIGGAPALIGASFAGPASQPFGGATILLAPPVIATWLQTSGSPGAPGAGQAAMSIAIPNSAAFMGSRLNFQGFVLDSGGPSGFSATGGLEMWVG